MSFSNLKSLCYQIFTMQKTCSNKRFNNSEEDSKSTNTTAFFYLKLFRRMLLSVNSLHTLIASGILSQRIMKWTCPESDKWSLVTYADRSRLKQDKLYKKDYKTSSNIATLKINNSNNRQLKFLKLQTRTLIKN